MLAGIHYASKNKLFLVGTEVIERLTGWPMGGSFSEPATLVDLGEAIRQLHEDVSVQRRVGWYFANTPIEKLVMGMLHVDDSLVGSCVYCHKCLFKGVESLWPPDVGTKLEEHGSRIRFLQADVHVLHGKQIEIYPASLNHLFANGSESQPTVSRRAHFVSRDVQDIFDLRCFLLAKVATFGQLAEGSFRRASSATTDFLSECLRLGWPQIWIAKILISLPRRGHADFNNKLKLLGKDMRRHTDLTWDHQTL